MLGGRSSYVRELGLPFLTDVVGGIEAIGFADEDVETTQKRFPELPPFPPDVRPQADITGAALLIGFGLYMASTISNAIVSAIGHDIYEQIVKPNLKKLVERARNEGRPSRTIATFDHWFDGSGVLVRVIVDLGAENDPAEDQTTTAVAAALRLAVTYLGSHPITHRVLTYSVNAGHVDPRPMLSEPIQPLPSSPERDDGR